MYYIRWQWGWAARRSPWRHHWQRQRRPRQQQWAVVAAADQPSRVGPAPAAGPLATGPGSGSGRRCRRQPCHRGTGMSRAGWGVTGSAIRCLSISPVMRQPTMGTRSTRPAVYARTDQPGSAGMTISLNGSLPSLGVRLTPGAAAGSLGLKVGAALHLGVVAVEIVPPPLLGFSHQGLGLRRMLLTDHTH